MPSPQQWKIRGENQPDAPPEALRSVYLKPGELLITREPCTVTTVLGSCVAVTMFHARLQYAGICHGMLPGPLPDGSTLQDRPERFKYISEAISFMLVKFRTVGAPIHEIEVKMFGGANVIGFHEDEAARRWIGTVNTQAARALLEAESMSIKTGCIGGTSGRKIFFNTQTGEVLHRYL